VETLDEAQWYEVVLVRERDELPVFSGQLEDCENWLALNGDAWKEGHFEIRPAIEVNLDHS